jgi:hypothetical protein
VAVVQRQVDSLTAFGQITRDGLELAGGSGGGAARIRAAHDVFLWLEKVFAEAPPLPSATRTKRGR